MERVVLKISEGRGDHAESVSNREISTAQNLHWFPNVAGAGRTLSQLCPHQGAPTAAVNGAVGNLTGGIAWRAPADSDHRRFPALNEAAKRGRSDPAW
jgi:hypothetical protein